MEPWRGVRFIAAGALLSGIGTLLLAFQSFSDGRTTVGWVVAILALLGIPCRVGGPIAAAKTALKGPRPLTVPNGAASDRVAAP
jgi:hypothetical protein